MKLILCFLLLLIVSCGKIEKQTGPYGCDVSVPGECEDKIREMEGDNDEDNP